jgi:transcriptional regulator with AAA-type ATPase domain
MTGLHLNFKYLNLFACTYVGEGNAHQYSMTDSELHLRESPDRTLSKEAWSETGITTLEPVIERESSRALPPPGATTILITGAIGTGKSHLAKDS